jgi:hypothetical protein
LMYKPICVGSTKHKKLIFMTSLSQWMLKILQLFGGRIRFPSDICITQSITTNAEWCLNLPTALVNTHLHNMAWRRLAPLIKIGSAQSLTTTMTPCAIGRSTIADSHPK